METLIRAAADDLVTLDAWRAAECALAAAESAAEPLDPTEWGAPAASAYAPTLPVVFPID